MDAAVVGDGFIAKDLWIENSAGAEKHQAVALRVQSDKSVFYNVRLDGYQDTLYVHTHRQFYRECTITGTIDFIFGDSASIFQNCLILARKPMDNQQNIVTAQGRKDRRSTGGIILHNCTISADPEYYPFRDKLPTFLGRPWKEYSRTFVMQSQLDDLINPKGWLPWLGDFGLDTCFYTEIDNRGPGADKSQRATWRGVKNVDLIHAQKFTVERFIQGKTWLPQTGLRETILHRNPLLSVDSVVHELLAEKIRLKSLVDKRTVAPSTPSVFAAPQRSMPHNQSRSTSKVFSDECAYCKEKGH
ncbi:hypothetical protein ZIOFF_004512 [Zingiber officinale]|uniref:Pectinesterase n=1 Tax=Zingiber officinale TaxID=94328 RepID=A0A8J5HU99_ZINOF|nr:hypothetical protein ZIOFF_004512 [Zingiber officinale]